MWGTPILFVIKFSHLFSLFEGAWFREAEAKQRYIGVMMLTLTPR